MKTRTSRGGAVSCWSEIDAKQLAFDAELAKARAEVEERAGKQTANTVGVASDGRLRLKYKGTEYFARSWAELFTKASLPPVPPPGPKLS